MRPRKPRPHFDEPPLIEAVFDLFAAPSTAKTAELERTFFERFPAFRDAREDWRQVEATFQVQGGMPPAEAAHMERLATRFWNAEHTRGLLFGPGVLAMNVLRPYGHFDDHAPLLRDITAAFFETARPQQLLWLGHRYLNQVTIELDKGTQASDLFTLYPRLPQTLASRHPPMAVQVEAARFQNGVVLANLALSALDSYRAVYTLDLYARTIDAVPLTPDDIVDWHWRAHDQVAETFLSCLTERARIRFKEHQ